MKRGSLLGIVLLSLVCAACWTTFVPPRPFEATEMIKRRSRLEGFTAYQDYPEKLVGRILTLKTLADGGCPSDRVFDVRSLTLQRYLLPDAGQPDHVQKTRVVYEKRIAGSAEGSGTFPFVSVTGEGKGAVEVVVTDVTTTNGTDYLDDQSARATAGTQQDCGRYLIENVVTSIAHVKEHTEASSKSEVVGTAFGIGGTVYNSNQSFQLQDLLFIDVIDIGTADAGPEKNLQFLFRVENEETLMQ